MSRSLARQALFCLLFQGDITGDFSPDTLDEMGDILKTPNFTEHINYVTQGAELFCDNREAIDGAIERNIKGWRIGRLSKVDLSILRLAVCEILFMPDIPGSVACNEAVELAKKYADKKSSAFINGVLASIIKEEVTK